MNNTTKTNSPIACSPDCPHCQDILTCEHGNKVWFDNLCQRCEDAATKPREQRG